MCIRDRSVTLVATEEVPYSFTFTSDDDDLRVSKDSTEQVILSIENKPSWLVFTYDAINETATLNGIPSNEDASTNYTMRVIATDEVGDTSYHEFTIAVSNVNDTPVLTNKESVTLVATEEVAYSFTFTSDDDDLRVSNCK